MLFIMCRPDCADLVNAIKAELRDLLGFEVDVELDEDQPWWRGFYPKKCETTGADIDEDLADVEIVDSDCNERVVIENLERLITAVKVLAQKYGNKLVYIMVTPAPTLIRFFESIIDRPVYALWFRDAPEKPHEIPVYYIVVYKVVMAIDPMLAHVLASIAAFPPAKELADKLEKTRAVVEKVGNGYLIVSIRKS